MSQMFGGVVRRRPRATSRVCGQMLGVECAGERVAPSPAGGPPGYDAYIVWQRFNPYKKVQVSGFTNEFVFVRPELPGDEDPFNP